MGFTVNINFLSGLEETQFVCLLVKWWLWSLEPHIHRASTGPLSCIRSPPGIFCISQRMVSVKLVVISALYLRKDARWNSIDFFVPSLISSHQVTQTTHSFWKTQTTEGSSTSLHLFFRGFSSRPIFKAFMYYPGIRREMEGDHSRSLQQKPCFMFLYTPSGTC